MSEQYFDREASTTINHGADSPFVLLCEHANAYIPAAYNQLGLNTEAAQSHIAWDIGAAGLTRQLCEELQAVAVLQNYSRLLYDCNREPSSPTAIPTQGEDAPIPGNAAISPAERQLREQRVYYPFHAAVDHLLQQRDAAGLASVIVTVHSFTPSYRGTRRDVDIGVLSDPGDERLAQQLLQSLTGGDYRVAANEPYSATDGVTFSLKRHAVASGRLSVMLEIRNDLISDTSEHNRWSSTLGNALNQALSQL